MSERTDRRLAELQGLRSNKPFDPEAFGALLEATFGRELPGLTGDPDLDIVRVTVESEGEGVGSTYELKGYSEGGTCRLWCAFDTQDGGIEVYIVITKGTTEASIDLFGEDVDDVGNPAMLFRVYDLTLAAAMASDLRQIRNNPCNLKLRRLYRWMGFRNGEILDLDNLASVQRALRFIERVYDETEGAHVGFERPW